MQLFQTKSAKLNMEVIIGSPFWLETEGKQMFWSIVSETSFVCVSLSLSLFIFIKDKNSSDGVHIGQG